MNTTTVTRPARSAPARSDRALPAGLREGLAAALMGLVPSVLVALLLWWGEDRSGDGVLDAAWSGAQLWLAAHGTALDGPGGRVALLPLGLTLVALWLCWRAGARAAAQDGAATAQRALRAAGGVAAAYASVALGVAALSGGPFRPVLWTALVGAGVLSFGGAAPAAMRTAGAGRSVWQRQSDVRRRALLTGTTAALLLLGAGALLVGFSLAVDGGRAADVAAAADPGAVGGLGLLLLGIALAPTAAVWGASWLAGPGFTVGASSSVAPFGVELGPVPALPLLAALPEGAPAGGLGLLALAVPVLAGALAGRRFCQTGAGWGSRLVDAAAAGVVAGTLLAVGAVLAAGSLGGERLAQLGPSAWRTGAAVALEVAAGVAVGAALRARRR